MASAFPNALGDDALLDELLSFLEEPLEGSPLPPDASSDSLSDSNSGGQSPVDVQEELPARAKKPRRVCSIKRALHSLRDEADALTRQLERLREEDEQNGDGAPESVLVERYKRRRAEGERQRLRDAVYAQNHFIRGLQSVFSAPPSFSSSLNLCRHLHNYTRLPRDRAARWKEYAAFGHETRLCSAMDILIRETEALALEDGDAPPWVSPQIQNDLTIDREGFAETTTSVYTVDTNDIGAVVRGACVAVRDIVGRCRDFALLNAKREIVDPDASTASSNNILYRAMDIRQRNRCFTDDELLLESRVVTFYKQTDDYAIVLWDYIDADDLHPAAEDTDISRQAIGACLIRREVCGDGVERSVYRSISTRRFLFHAQSPQDKLLRYQQTSLADGGSRRANELLFRELMLESIAKEEAAFAHAMTAFAMASA